MGNYPRTTRILLGYRDHQEQWASPLYCGQLEAQLHRYLVHLFQDRDFSQSRLATSHSSTARVRHGLAAPSSAWLTPPVSSPCPDANGGIGPLAIGLLDWLTLRLPRKNKMWKGESTKV